MLLTISVVSTMNILRNNLTISPYFFPHSQMLSYVRCLYEVDWAKYLGFEEFEERLVHVSPPPPPDRAEVRQLGVRGLSSPHLRGMDSYVIYLCIYCVIWPGESVAGLSSFWMTAARNQEWDNPVQCWSPQMCIDVVLVITHYTAACTPQLQRVRTLWLFLSA